MSLNKQSIEKLKTRKATLKADHSCPKMMHEVLKEAFTEDGLVYADLVNEKYYFAEKDGRGFETSNKETVGDLIELVDFYESYDLPSELDYERINAMKEISNLTIEEVTLIELIRIRNIYRKGSELNGHYYSYNSTVFSFQNQETLDLFLESFRKDLELIRCLVV